MLGKKGDFGIFGPFAPPLNRPMHDTTGANSALPLTAQL